MIFPVAEVATALILFISAIIYGIALKSSDQCISVKAAARA